MRVGGTPQGSLWWENWVLMMPSSLSFCCLCLCLPLVIWLSLVLVGLAVSDFGSSLLHACVSVFLEDQFSLGGIWVWRAVAQCQLWDTYGNWYDPVPGHSLAPMSLLGQEFEQKCLSHLCSQVCQHSWETSSFLVGPGYGQLCS